MNDRILLVNKINEAVKIIQEKSSKSIAFVASELNIAEKTIYNWKSGKSLPDAMELEKLATLAGKNIQWFFGNDSQASTIENKITEQLKVTNLPQYIEFAEYVDLLSTKKECQLLHQQNEMLYALLNRMQPQTANTQNNRIDTTGRTRSGRDKPEHIPVRPGARH